VSVRGALHPRVSGSASLPHYATIMPVVSTLQATATPSPSVDSRWRASPRRLTRLLIGAWIFGTGDGLVVTSELGNSPWTVFSEGVSVQTPLTIGAATIATSFALLLLWIPLRQRPGLGTVVNAIVVGVAIDVAVAVVPHAPLGVRALELLLGIGLVGVGSGLYIGAALGAGPRDGLMVGLHHRTGRPIALIRGSLEVTALAVGWVLGGTVGVGTVTFALLIGPSVALGLHLIPPRRPADP
jgi:uncharacterized membrane protein YczE